MKKLTDDTDLPIVETNDESGSVPYFIIDEKNGYGIACDGLNEILVKSKPANRTVKDENGNDDHIESYILWQDKGYAKDFEGALNLYIKTVELELHKHIDKSVRLKYSDLIDIRNEIKDTVYNALNIINSVSISSSQAKKIEKLKAKEE